MNLQNTIVKGLIDKLIPIMLDYAITNLDELRKFLTAQALKTDNKIDDYMVDVIMDWLSAFLKGLKS